MKAVVVGAGIGGPAAPLSLRAVGHDVTLVERTRRFTGIGAGIQLAPNATRVLRRLDTVAARAAHPTRLTFHTWSDGTEICRCVIGPEAEAEFGAPYLQVHRADLHQALADRVPPGSVRLDTEAVGIYQDDRQAYVTTAGGERLAADLVVTADGVRSSARQWLFGADEAVFSGTAAYRALLPAAEVADLDMPEGRHVVHYWVRGGELLNLVAVFTAKTAPESWAEWTESWTAKAEPGEQLREFTGWDPPIRTALERAGQVFRYAIHTRTPLTRTPLTRWHLGRVTLLGDSAHAMVPFQAQGAAQAITDAAVLGDCLADATPDGIPDALTRYVHRRLTTATRVRAGSASAGEVYHLPDGRPCRGPPDRR